MSTTTNIIIIIIFALCNIGISAHALTMEKETKKLREDLYRLKQDTWDLIIVKPTFYYMLKDMGYGNPIVSFNINDIEVGKPLMLRKERFTEGQDYRTSPVVDVQVVPAYNNIAAVRTKSGSLYLVRVNTVLTK